MLLKRGTQGIDLVLPGAVPCVNVDGPFFHFFLEYLDAKAWEVGSQVYHYDEDVCEL